MIEGHPNDISDEVCEVFIKWSPDYALQKAREIIREGRQEGKEFGYLEKLIEIYSLETGSYKK